MKYKQRVYLMFFILNLAFSILFAIADSTPGSVICFVVAFAWGFYFIKAEE